MNLLLSTVADLPDQVLSARVGKSRSGAAWVTERGILSWTY